MFLMSLFLARCVLLSFLDYLTMVQQFHVVSTNSRKSIAPELSSSKTLVEFRSVAKTRKRCGVIRPKIHHHNKKGYRILHKITHPR